MKDGKTTWFLAGGVFAGIAASLCCLGPLLALGLGLGGFAAAAWFATWRPVLLGVTFVLLGLAWYLTYRRPRAACAENSCAQPPGRVALVGLGLGTLVALGAAIFPALPTANRRVDASASAVGDASISVSVPSMDCPACATGLEASLRRVPGVKQVTVNFDSKLAALAYDPAVVSRDQLLAVIDASGFPAERSTLR